MSTGTPEADANRINLPDSIDERTDLDALLKEAKGTAHIDCRQLKRINSIGIRGAKLALNQLKEKGVSIVLHCMTPPLVEAADFVSNLLPEGTKIESIYLPYCCESCGHSFMVLEVAADLKKKLDGIDTASCEKCGKLAEFDHVPEMYLKWLDRYPT